MSSSISKVTMFSHLLTTIGQTRSTATGPRFSFAFPSRSCFTSNMSMWLSLFRLASGLLRATLRRDVEVDPRERDGKSKLPD